MTTIAGEPQRTARPGAEAPPVVTLSHVCKNFRLPHERYHTLKQRALNLFRSRGADVLRAVDDVSVEIGEGEFFGIVGRNGSGKSTLLKCLAGIYQTDSGALSIRGRLSPFIELGVGFNPELTATDNVIINAIMLGLSRREALARYDQIVAFAELEEFMSLKLKNYSSGMHVRLAFAVAIQVDADIVLIDEVLAVGDAAFQQKCYDEFTRLKAAGRTILFVTHDMGAVERFCDRAMLLERGRVVDIGMPAQIARRYNQLNFERGLEERSAEASASAAALDPPAAEIMSAYFESGAGEAIVTVNQGEPCRIRMDIRFHGDIENPIFAAGLESETGHVAFATSTQIRHIPTGNYRAGDIATVRIPFENWLGPGRYRLITSVASGWSELDVQAVYGDSSLLVLAPLSGGGTADLPHRFEIERG